MVWILFCLLFVVSFSGPMIIPQGGDPAPGRSPGPPERSFLEENKVSSLDSAPENNENLVNATWCHAVSSAQSGLTSTPFILSLVHEKFSVDAGLVAGIYYQVTIKSSKSNKSAVTEVYVSTDRGMWMGETYLQECRNESGADLLTGAVKVLSERVPLSWKLSEPPSQPSNVTFRVLGRTAPGYIYEQFFSFSVITDCAVVLNSRNGNLSSNDMPHGQNCAVTFQVDNSTLDATRRRGLLLHLTRLNVACLNGGFLEMGGINPPKRLCGKLEDLAQRDRTFHFPADSLPRLNLMRRPIFSLNFTSVDFCYNVTMTSRNGTVSLTPTDTLYCHFRIHLPFGNRVRLLLQVGEEPTTTVASREYESLGNASSCRGLFVIVWNGASDWTHCSNQITPKPNVEVESVGNVVTVHVMAEGADHYPTLRFWYSAVPVPDVVGSCGFGEVAVRKFCVFPVQKPLSWPDAEAHCVTSGGHLLSIRDEHAQFLVDSLLIKSPLSQVGDSYWIGASDLAYEGHYQWSDGHAFSYSNWFPGWQHHGFYNKQPNDDGLSRQDCVEMRRSFPSPSAYGMTIASSPSYLWNDIDCSTLNFFLCERPKNRDSIEESWWAECNRSITLSREYPRAVVTSPGFPYHYPDNVQCRTMIIAPHGYRIVLDFEELVLEKEPMCSYDYLEIEEVPENKTEVAPRRTHYCGDMSDKLKLLRYGSESSILKLLFVSDYSNHFGGFKARVSLENARKDCSDENQKIFNNFCYLFVGYPQVTWHTAQQICSGMKSHLASVVSPDEQTFITSNLRKSSEYTASSTFWLGGHISDNGQWNWLDNQPFNFTSWAPYDPVDNVADRPNCLGLRWVPSALSSGPSGLYWAPNECTSVGGYVCKKPATVSSASADLGRTINGTEGFLSSPGFPGPYRSDLDYEVRLVGPPWTRLIFSLSKLDIEHQADCLYDFIELRSGTSSEYEKRWCGTWNTKLNQFNFVSRDNEAYMRFRSDYSVSGTGFSATWRAVDVAGCPSQTLTAREGILSSPNYPEFILPGLDCTTTILAAPGKRVWLEFTEIDMQDDNGKSFLELDLGGDRTSFAPLWNTATIGSRNFVSWGEKLVVRFSTSVYVKGAGFRAVYRSVNAVHEDVLVDVSSDAFGNIFHLNYPSDPPRFVDFLEHFVAPLGYVIVLEFYGVLLSERGSSCPDGRGVIEVNDNYADVNGTWWFVCPADDLALQRSGNVAVAPITITSYLHTVHVRQRSFTIGLYMNATLKVKEDPQFKLKILGLPEDMGLESCRPNPCLNGGKCLNSAVKKSCQCTSHFTGLFCALTQCELEPCLFGVCELTTTGYHCRCHGGYNGPACEIKQRPCAENPCEGRGDCIERGDAFHCQCHAWWEGVRCERKMIHIPYKPLSERMLQEPFWLGLITVFVVLGVIGLFWCAKRHFPEKLEKLLAEEADRHGRANIPSRPASSRDLVGAATQLQSPSAVPPRTLLGRLGIRKPSLLSLSSPAPVAITAPRTFSLDDLLRPSPRRSPSPREKRINSTPSNKNAAEKKQILQQLISPSASTPSGSKVRSDQLMQMREQSKLEPPGNELKVAESSFSNVDVPYEDRSEKKVTFARLISKVSAEMSSGSEVDFDKPQLTRALSTPASPATRRTSDLPCHGDSLSSLDMTISADTSTLDTPVKRPNRLTRSTNRNPSADSLLAMLRNVAMDESYCSDESLAVDTPLSSSSGALDSPCLGVTIDVEPETLPKMNFLLPPMAHLELPSGVSKCLSPIREVPTPISSPAFTPIMSRVTHKNNQRTDSSEEEKLAGEDTEQVTDCGSELIVQIHHRADSPEKLPLFIPIVTVEEPSPKLDGKDVPTFVFNGSPPPQKREFFPSIKIQNEVEKPTSLDLIHPPPMITITCNASEGESDTESSKQAQTLNPTSANSGMNYLSPFSICSRGDRTASESNLSSSGYSSMASPGPSRCGSNNPLCLSEVEDHSGNGQPPSRRPSPLLRTPNSDADHLYRRRRSDSETLSDDPLIESNDEGIGTDHLEEKPDENQEGANFSGMIPVPPPRGVKKGEMVDSFISPLCRTSLQLPTIVVQSDFCDKMLSPVSSRSESPLSDKTLGLGRFSPMFYCKNKSDQLPFTDSDGLYDFPSSDCPPSKHKSVQASVAPHRKKKERRPSASRQKSPSPTKGLVAADPPVRTPRKPSPKRRVRAQAPPSSSSSTDSLTFSRGNVCIRLTSPDGTERPVKNPKEFMTPRGKFHENSGEDTDEEISDGIVSSPEDVTRPVKKVGRLRTIAHQIRFLRRIERSLRRKRFASQSDSDECEDNSADNSVRESLLPRVVRTTLMAANTNMRKSNSHGVLCSGRRRFPKDLPLLSRRSSISNHTD